MPVSGHFVFHCASHPSLTRPKKKKSLLDGNRDQLLAVARSELMKEEYKVESLNTCIREFQRQTHSQRLELDDAHCGYEES